MARRKYPIQAKHVRNAPVLAFLALNPERWHTWFDAHRFGDDPPENSVVRAMPVNTPRKVVLAKMRALIRRGLVEGCPCGCRGDFQITKAGLAWIKNPSNSWL